MIDATSGVGPAYTSGALEFTPIFSEVRVTRYLVLCVCFVDRCLSFCTFSFGHCVVITSLVSSNSSCAHNVVDFHGIFKIISYLNMIETFCFPNMHTFIYTYRTNARFSFCLLRTPVINDFTSN